MKKKKKSLNTAGKKNSSMDKLRMFLCIAGFLFFIFYCFRLSIYNSILDSNSKSIEAVIIDEKNILGKGVITDMFTYSYRFNIGNDSYYGDSKDERYKVGYKIMVEYWPIWPFVNRPEKKRESGN